MRGCRPLEAAEVRKAQGAFAGPNAARNRALFMLGICTGFRISELLSIRLADVLEQGGTLKDRVTVYRRAMKGKRPSRTVRLNTAAKRALVPWLQEMKRDGYLAADSHVFHSRRGSHPIDRIQAYKILRGTFRRCGLLGRLGTHAMRKTFANEVYSDLLARVARGQAVDAFRATSKALGHADIKSTDQYLSFREEEIDSAVDALGGKLQ